MRISWLTFGLVLFPPNYISKVKFICPFTFQDQRYTWNMQWNKFLIMSAHIQPHFCAFTYDVFVLCLCLFVMATNTAITNYLLLSFCNRKQQNSECRRNFHMFESIIEKFFYFWCRRHYLRFCIFSKNKL